MKKWLIIITYLTVCVGIVWAYTFQHTGPEIDTANQIALDIGAGTGIVESDGANNISFRAPVTVITPPGVDTEIPSEKAIVDYHTANDQGEDNVGANVGAGSQVYQGKTGVNLNFRTITGSGAVTVVQGADTIDISTSPSVGEANTGANVGTGEGEVYQGKTSTTLNFKKLQAGANVSISDTGNEIIITGDVQPGTGEANTASNIGAGAGVFSDKVGVDLRFKSIVAGNNMTVSPGPTDITLQSETSDGANVGTGEATIYRNKTIGDPDTLNFKRLQAGNNITLTNNANEVIINSTATGGGIAGPPSSTDQGIARWSGTGGDTLEDSSVAVDDSGNLYNVTSVQVNPSTDPSYVFQDSDMPAANKEVVWFNAGYVGGVATQENAEWSIDVIRNGAQTNVFGFVSGTGRNVSPFHINVPLDTYDTGWNGDLSVPTKADLYTKIESIAAGGESNALQSVGTGAGDLDAGKSGTNLQIKTISGGNGIAITNNASEVDVSGVSAAEGTAGVVAGLANSLDINFGGEDAEVITPAALNASRYSFRDVGIHVFNSDQPVAVGVDTAGYAIEFFMGDYRYRNLTCSVWDPGVDGSLTIQVLRRRAGVNTSLMSAPLTITTGYTGNTSNVGGTPDVDSGDILMIEVITNHTTTPANGLTCTVRLEYDLP